MRQQQTTIVGLLCLCLLTSCTTRAQTDRSDIAPDRPRAASVDKSPNEAIASYLAAAREGNLSGVSGRISAAVYGASDPVRIEIQLRDLLELNVETCMAGHGWKYEPNLARAEDVRQDLLLQETGSGLADTARRTTEGYGITSAYLDGLQEEVGNPAEAAYYAALTQSEQGTFDRHLSACDAESREKTGLSGKLWDDYDAVLTEAYEATLGDERLATAEDEWRGCMSDNGLAFESPGDIAASFELRAKGLFGADNEELTAAPRPSPELRALFDEELVVAETDWICQLDSTIATWLTLRSEIEERLFEEHSELFKQVGDRIEEVLGN